MAKVTRREARLGAERLAVRLVAPPRGTAAVRGTVFVPPLIGGSGMQQVGYFRGLNRRGYRLATFDYRGHGKSLGRFSVRNALADAVAALDDVLRATNDEPLLGLADCFGAIPLLHAATLRPGAFRSLVLVNPIHSLQAVATPRALLANYFRPRDSAGERRFVWRNPLDLRGILLATNELLFPDIDKSRDHFGILSYADAHVWRTSWEYLVSRPLDGLVCGLPAIVWLGRSDGLLGLERPEEEARQRALWRRHLPQGDVRVIEDADHFWTGIRSRVGSVVAESYAELEAAPRQRDPGEQFERNHQLGGMTRSPGLKRTVGRYSSVSSSVGASSSIDIAHRR